jgi:hypothetical protein
MSGREKMGKREESVLADEPAVNSRSCEILVFQPERFFFAESTVLFRSCPI